MNYDGPKILRNGHYLFNSKVSTTANNIIFNAVCTYLRIKTDFWNIQFFLVLEISLASVFISPALTTKDFIWFFVWKYINIWKAINIGFVWYGSITRKEPKVYNMESLKDFPGFHIIRFWFISCYLSEKYKTIMSRKRHCVRYRLYRNRKLPCSAWVSFTADAINMGRISSIKSLAG